MTKLSDTQVLILSAAAQRDGHIVLPLPANLRGGAATKVVTAMLRKGLIDEVEADPRKGETLWRETGDGHGTTLIATEAGLAAIGIEPEDADCALTGADAAPGTKAANEAPVEANQAATGADVAPARKPREGTKQAMLIQMLRAEGGATIDEIVAVTQWRPHTVRGFIAGTLKKKLGLEVTSEKVEPRGRIYAIRD